MKCKVSLMNGTVTCLNGSEYGIAIKKKVYDRLSMWVDDLNDVVFRGDYSKIIYVYEKSFNRVCAYCLSMYENDVVSYADMCALRDIFTRKLKEIRDNALAEVQY